HPRARRSVSRTPPPCMSRALTTPRPLRPEKGSVMRSLKSEIDKLRRDIEARTARTTAAAHRPDVLAGVFPEARAFIDDPAELKWCLSTRRAAKSYSVAL